MTDQLTHKCGEKRGRAPGTKPPPAKPPEIISTWLGSNSKMPFQLPHCPHTESCVPLKGPSSIRVLVLHHITQFCIHTGLLTSHTPGDPGFSSTLCVWVYFCISVSHVHAMSIEARRKHGIPWGWGHRQLEATMLMLRIYSVSSLRAARAPNS